MHNLLTTLGKFTRGIIDFFYPPFRKFMSLQFFRYGVTGSANLVFDWVLYFLIYNFALWHKNLDLGFVTLSSHIAALAIKVPIVLLSGFLLQKYVTFSSSKLNAGVQLFRYSIVFLVNLCISYFGMKLLVDGFNLYPSPSNIMISILTVFISYFSQKLYTFKTSNAGELQELQTTPLPVEE
ncbi:MAG: GtrA family protein [Bacteroidota bacterium]